MRQFSANGAPAGRPGPVTPEPVTPGPPRPVRRPLLTQRWQDLTFLHWPADPGLVAPLLPPGVRPDVFDGTSYVGLIAFHAQGTGFFGLPGLPYLGSFPEINVRLYSTGPDGRRGVTFRSLDAARLLPVLVARAAFGLPYRWSLMRVRRRGDVISYASRSRWPGPGAEFRLRVKVGERLASPSAAEQFVTARWGLHARFHGRGVFYLPNEHPRWSLHRATLLSLREDLIAAAGLPPPAGEPVSVLYSPGVPVRLGAPRWLDRPAAGG